jgi:hypothetical protein
MTDIVPVVKCDIIPICPYIRPYYKLHELWIFLKYDLSPSVTGPCYLCTDINKIISASVIQFTQNLHKVTLCLEMMSSRAVIPLQI